MLLEVEQIRFDCPHNTILFSLTEDGAVLGCNKTLFLGNFDVIKATA